MSVLLRTPDWVKTVLPEDAFTRSDFKPLQRDHTQDDPELGFRYAPNLNVPVIEGEMSFRAITDSFGFANIDETLYIDADVVVTGDSFTQGFGVEFHESWPEQLAQETNLRVLNLGTNSWSVYHYPRVLEKFGGRASPSAVVVTLTSFNDLAPDTYAYRDYKRTHPNVRGYRDLPSFSKTGINFWSNLKKSLENRNYMSALYEAGRNVLPFSSTTASHFMSRLGSHGLSKFALNGKTMELRFNSGQFRDNETVPFLDSIGEDLARVKRFAEQHGSRVYFVYLPMPVEIYLPLLGSAEALGGDSNMQLADYEADKLKLDQYYKQYEQSLGQDAGLLRDSTPFLQQAALSGKQLAWQFDPHPNQAGQQAIAEFVASILEE